MKLVSKKGREYKELDLKKNNNTFNVLVEDNEIDFNLDFISNFSVLLKQNGKITDLNYIVENNIVTIYQNGKEYKFEFLDEKTIRRLSSIGGMQASGPMIIDSPMPSKIIKINFNKGDKVKKGDIVMIIEAMKMENEMKAPYDGTITDIFTLVNNTVESGAKLFSIE